jgi:hypothetical protein
MRAARALVLVDAADCLETELFVERLAGGRGVQEGGALTERVHGAGHQIATDAAALLLRGDDHHAERGVIRAEFPVQGGAQESARILGADARAQVQREFPVFAAMRPFDRYRQFVRGGQIAGRQRTKPDGCCSKRLSHFPLLFNMPA